MRSCRREVVVIAYRDPITGTRPVARVVDLEGKPVCKFGRDFARFISDQA